MARSERPLLVLAAVAVLTYLADLRGLPAKWGLEGLTHTLEVVLDTVFVLDVVVKAVVLGPKYRRGPWLVVDLICALPALGHLPFAPDGLGGLRFVRGFRLFRIMGTLRVLRSLRLLRLIQFGPAPAESRTFERAMSAAVLVYTGAFLLLLGVLVAGAPQGVVTSVAGHPVDSSVVVESLGASGVTTRSMPLSDVVITAEHVEFLLVVGAIAGMALILVVVRFQIPDLTSRHVHALLNVALPAQVARHFLTRPTTSYEALRVRAPATVIFVDIVGFTAATEALGSDLDALRENLQAAMDAVVAVHLEHDLVVDKFIGDAIMSFRGGDLVDGDPEDHAARVVRAALGSVAAVAALGNPWFRQVKVGGASAEDALIGTFGTSSRLSYTILGDRVNLASRLESACGRLGTATLFCDRTHHLTAGRADIVWRRVGRLRVDGKRAPEPVFEAFDPVRDTAFVATYEAALVALEAGHLDAARAGFTQADRQREGGDGPSRRWLAALDAWGPDAEAVLTLSKHG